MSQLCVSQGKPSGAAGGVLRGPGPWRALRPPLQGAWWEPAAAWAPRSCSGPFAFVCCGSDRGYRHCVNFLSPFYAVISVLLNICHRRTRALSTFLLIPGEPGRTPPAPALAWRWEGELPSPGRSCCGPAGTGRGLCPQGPWGPGGPQDARRPVGSCPPAPRRPGRGSGAVGGSARPPGPGGTPG